MAKTMQTHNRGAPPTKPRVITSLFELIEALQVPLEEIGALYDPPLSRQAIGQWLTANEVPPARVLRLLRYALELGYQVDPKGLHPDFVDLPPLADPRA